MLLRFSVSNYGCFADKATLNMIASEDTRLRDTHVVEGEPPSVRLAALYGANAAGKTRFTRALAVARELILKDSEVDRPLPIQPFRLRRDLRSHPSVFEFVVRLDHRVWTYGFAATRERIVEEWLVQGPPECETPFFVRSEGEDDKTVTRIEAALVELDTRDDARNRLQYLVDDLPATQLVLSELRRREHPAVRDLVHWLSEGFIVVAAAARYLPLEDRTRRETDFAQALGQFLSAAATGIDSVAVQEQPLDNGPPPDELEEALGNYDLDQGVMLRLDGQYIMIRRSPTGLVQARLSARRLDDAGEPVVFEFNDESAGTRQLMNLFPILADGGKSPRTIVVDELDRMLHPSLSRAFIELFIRIAHPESQLIFTTHESRLMKRDVLRQDEIWVFSKTRAGASRLEPLSDYDIPARMDLDEAYLDGRFGGVPHLSRLERLDLQE